MNDKNEKKFVKLSLDIYCFWLNEPPVYRIYINDELFCDRTYHWKEENYLQENFQIFAPPGLYTIKIENNDKHIVDFLAKNLQIKKGNAKKISDREFEIL